MKIGKPKTAERTLPKVQFPFVQDNDHRACNDEGTYWDLYRDGITQGWLGAFLDCPEKARLGLSLGLSGQRWSGGALEFGSLFHEVLDAVYTEAKTHTLIVESKVSPLRAINAVEVSKELAKHAATWLPTFLEKKLDHLYSRETKRMRDFPPANVNAYDNFEENFGLVKVMLFSYFARWKDDLAQYRWQSLEQKFRLPYHPSKTLGLDKPVIYLRGKIDGVFRVPGNRLWLFETKTKGQINEEDILDGLSYNLQVMVYMWAMRQLYGEEPAGVLYNIIRRPLLKRKAGQTLNSFLDRVAEDVTKRPDHYFIRYECVVLSQEIKRWNAEFDQMMLKLIRWNDGEGHHRQPSACKGRFGRCQFMPICGRDAYSGFKQREHHFPELDGEGE